MIKINPAANPATTHRNADDKRLKLADPAVKIRTTEGYTPIRCTVAPGFDILPA
jgi:hypothetical protein